jgi:hypothetical protein
MVRLVAETGNGHLLAAIREASPLTLHGRTCWRTDGNSPVRISHDGAIVYFSSYQPIGHTLRSRGSRDLRFVEQPVPITFTDAPDPGVGRWIEAIWQAPGGPLRGWYHAEQPALCTGAQLYVPYIGEAASEDGGLTWHCRRELLRLPADRVDCSWRNGFFAGGYGDLSVVPDRRGQALYLFFSSYHPAEDAQGVAVLRLSADAPSAPPLWWTSAGWQAVGEFRPKPLWPAVRSFRHSDPDCFWGPAVHYNRALGAYVMLLNHTAGGDGDFLQEGIYASMNAEIDDPGGWTPPLQIVRGGAWYPQAVGLEEGCGDTETAKTARFFMAGFSGWDIEFARPAGGHVTNRPLTCTKQGFAEMFGADRRCPW